MQDTALYQYLLGLNSPWTVSRVELNAKGQCVDVWAEHPEGALWACPTCARELPLYDHAEQRTWRHLDSCQYQTHLHARIPRVQCGEHGVVQVKVAVGGTAVEVHAALRTPGPRRAGSMRRDGSHEDIAGQLGRGLGDDGARGQAGPAAQSGEGRAADRGR